MNIFKSFENKINPYPKVGRINRFSKMLHFCFAFSKGFHLPILALTIISSLIAILDISLFTFLGRIVDWLSGQDKAHFFESEKWRLLSMGLVLLVFLPALNVISALIKNQMLMGNFPMTIRWRMHSFLLNQSLGFYQNEFAGRLATKVMQTALAMRDLIMKLMDIIVYIVVYFVSMLFLLGSMNFWILFPVLIWFIAYLALQIYFVPRLKKISMKQAHARSTMTGRIVDAYANILTIKLFSHTDREEAYAKGAMQTFLDTVYKQFRLVTGLDVSLNTLNNLLIFSVAGTGIALWWNDSMSVGGVAIAVSLVLRLKTMSHWVLWEVSNLFENMGTVNDGMSLLATPNQVVDAKDAENLIVKNAAIDFQSVHFTYEQTDKEGLRHQSVIHDLNLSIKGGEKIGLVGRSGAGKSTLVNALLRFYNLQSGKITIDGQDIARVKQESLRKAIAMVSQDTSLLHRSVRDNVLYGRPDASDEEVNQALKQAEAFEFIQQLTDSQGNHGLDAQVGERGVKLSGGQRQRIAIARVLLKNAPILILDEATSALDSEVEAAIQESLISLMQGKTVIAIAHRLSTIAAMDRLVVLDKGMIVEEGTHQALLDKNGIYANLWQRQTGGYLGED